MTAHLHAEFVPGCYRCELAADEVPRSTAGLPSCCQGAVEHHAMYEPVFTGTRIKCPACGSPLVARNDTWEAAA